MLRRIGVRWLAGVGLAAAALFWSSGTAAAQAPCGDCAPHCQHKHCPPPLNHCWEGPPRIKFRHACPKPICNPCQTQAPNWGYYQTCWTPWPWPPDWNHCPVQPPAAVVLPGVMQPGAATEETSPPPRKIRPGL